MQGKQGRTGAVVEVSWAGPAGERRLVGHRLECAGVAPTGALGAATEVYCGPLTAWYATTLAPGEVRRLVCVCVCMCVGVFVCVMSV